jgi:hypothetical protein
MLDIQNLLMREDLRDSSYTWGMSDTPWCDNLYEWWETNMMNNVEKESH